MFNWLKLNSSPPPLCQENPGKGIELDLAFADNNKNWIEHLNLVECLADILRFRGYKLKQHKSYIKLDSGFLLQPQIVAFYPLDDGGIRTVTTININHNLLISQGFFEYQHSAGDDFRESIVKGFEGWIDTDLVVLLDVQQQELKNSTLLTINFPEEETKTPFERKIILGFPSHFCDHSIVTEEEHPFCPCCLFTNSSDAFVQQVESTNFYAIRLFVMRDLTGKIDADCRVNGEDWELGKQALIKYARYWRDRGMEFRKQYIIIHS